MVEKCNFKTEYMAVTESSLPSNKDPDLEHPLPVSMFTDNNLKSDIGGDSRIRAEHYAVISLPCMSDETQQSDELLSADEPLPVEWAPHVDP